MSIPTRGPYLASWKYGAEWKFNYLSKKVKWTIQVNISRNKPKRNALWMAFIGARM